MALSQHDQQYLSAEQQAQILELTNQWNALNEQRNAAANRGEDVSSLAQQMNNVHLQAEAIRASAGYSGNADGSGYTAIAPVAPSAPVSPATPTAPSPGASVPETPPTQTPTPEAPTAPTAPVVQATMPNTSGAELAAQWKAQNPQLDTDTLVQQWSQGIPNVEQAKSEQQALLNQWREAATQQRNEQISNSVNQGVTELERTLEDAQTGFKQQQESVTREEMQSRDNAALYAEARGDKGGIGQEQYSAVMNTAAQNRMAVQQAQAKLSTDIQRQIADLRAQGEFNKADAALEISQQYLAQLTSLEQWAFDAGLTTEQFKVSLKQWAADYQMAMAQFNLGMDQWAAEFDTKLAQYLDSLNMWNAEFNYNKEQAGIANEQWLQQFNFNKEQAGIANEQWLQQFKAANEQWLQEFNFNKEQAGIANEQWLQEFNFAKEQAASSGSSRGGTTGTSGSTNALYQLAANNIPIEQARGWLVAEGFDPDEAREIANAYSAMLSSDGTPATGPDDTSSVEVTPTGTISNDGFRQAIRSITIAIDSKQDAQAQRMLDSLWPRLDTEQRNQLQNTLVGMGIEYTPGG